MRPLLKLFLFAIVSVVVTRLAALVVSRSLEEGSEVSDEVRRAVILDYVDLASRAGGLRSAEISVLLGGATFDLRDAVLDPGGAQVLAENTLGWLEIVVRDDWAVTVHDTIVGGGENDVRVTPPTDLPADAPTLEIELINRVGGTAVRAESSDSLRLRR